MAVSPNTAVSLHSASQELLLEMHSVLLDSTLQMPITEIKSLCIFLLIHQNRACKIYQQHYAIGSALCLLAGALDSPMVGIYSCSAHAVTKET